MLFGLAVAVSETRDRREGHVMRIPLPACLFLALVLGVAGFFIGKAVEADARPAFEAAPVGSEASGTGEPDSGKPASSEKPDPDSDAAADALLAASKRIQELEQQLKTSRDEVADLSASLDDAQGKKAATAATLLAKLEQFRKNGLAAFLAPGATADIISDLKSMGAEGVEMMLELLGSESKEDRFLAAKLLEDLADPSSIPHLKKAALEDGDTMVANMASHAIALMNNPGGATALHEIVANSPHLGAKINSMFGLCAIGDEKGVEMTRKYMEDDDNPESLKQALGRGILILNTPKVMVIVNLISKEVRAVPEVMQMVVSYYARIGTAEARTQLQNLLNDPNLPASVREQTLSALN
jgi:HEAT repeat protein